MRGLDFGRDDLYRPDAIAHLGAGLSKDRGTLLRAFTRVGNNLDGMFWNRSDFNIAVSWPVQFYLLPVPEESKKKIFRLPGEDTNLNHE